MHDCRRTRETDLAMGVGERRQRRYQVDHGGARGGFGLAGRSGRQVRP
jgi:hypothetical protein